MELASKVFDILSTYGPSFLRPVVFKVKMGMTLQKKDEENVLTADPRRILSDFLKMTGYPSFALIEAIPS